MSFQWEEIDEDTHRGTWPGEPLTAEVQRSRHGWTYKVFHNGKPAVGRFCFGLQVAKNGSGYWARELLEIAAAEAVIEGLESEEATWEYLQRQIPAGPWRWTHEVIPDSGLLIRWQFCVDRIFVDVWALSRTLDDPCLIYDNPAPRNGGYQQPDGFQMLKGMLMGDFATEEEPSSFNVNLEADWACAGPGEFDKAVEALARIRQITDRLFKGLNPHTGEKDGWRPPPNHCQSFELVGGAL